MQMGEALIKRNAPALLAALVAATALAAGGWFFGGPAPAHASEVNGVCAWPVRDNADLVNVAFPDESAHYWGSMAVGIPETGVVVRGRYPQARYFSLHTYNMTLGAYDALSDREIEPASGVNPFVKRGKRGTGEGDWEVRILPGEPPESRPPNTMYTGETSGVPNLAAIVVYRVYVSDDPEDPEGGVGLPTVNLTLGGEEVPVPFSGCSLTSELPGTPANDAIRESSFPDSVVIPTRGATNPPEWWKFFGFGGSIGRQVGIDPLTALLDGTLPGGGFLNNQHNDYMSASISREFGDVVVMRAKMPTFPDTRAGQQPWRRSQLRYWSICQNHAVSQRYVACLADHQTVRNRHGRATFVISDPDDRPANATPENGVNWLPWGGAYSSGLIIYRQMLASPSFKYALARVNKGDPLAPALGPYMPRIVYCTTERFESEGATGCLSGQ